MPSDPLPDWDHFAAVAVEVGKDARLTADERALLGRTAARLRKQFLGKSEMLTMYAANLVRVQTEILAARAAKRLEALEVFNKTNDTLNRISYRYGRPLPGVSAGKGGDSSPPGSWGRVPPPIRTIPPRREEPVVDAPAALIESPDGGKAILEDGQEQAGAVEPAEVESNDAAESEAAKE